MKKRNIIKTLLSLIVLILIFYFQFARTSVINNSITTQHAGGYEAILTVTANKLVITNPKAYAASLVSQVSENSFSNFMFSYDQLGYPSKLTVTVYTNDFTKQLGMPAFSFRYETDGSDSYNIKDNPEKFEIILDTK